MIAAGGRLGRPEVEAIHNEAISRFGGMPGLRDPGLLDSALAQPFQTFGGVDLYPTLAQKAARYAWGIARNHPFADGNKRTAAACMAAYLRIFVSLPSLNKCHSGTSFIGCPFALGPRRFFCARALSCPERASCRSSTLGSSRSDSRRYSRLPYRAWDLRGLPAAA